MDFFVEPIFKKSILHTLFFSWLFCKNTDNCIFLNPFNSAKRCLYETIFQNSKMIRRGISLLILHNVIHILFYFHLKQFLQTATPSCIPWMSNFHMPFFACIKSFAKIIISWSSSYDGFLWNTLKILILINTSIRL